MRAFFILRTKNEKALFFLYFFQNEYVIIKESLFFLNKKGGRHRDVKHRFIKNRIFKSI